MTPVPVLSPVVRISGILTHFVVHVQNILQFVLFIIHAGFPEAFVLPGILKEHHYLGRLYLQRREKYSCHASCGTCTLPSLIVMQALCNINHDDPEEMMGKPLSGMKILDFTYLLPGPFGTMMLADLGADIIKVENPVNPDLMRLVPPFVNGMSAAYAQVNRGNPWPSTSRSPRRVILSASSSANTMS
jgi:hypothetical protein